MLFLILWLAVEALNDAGHFVRGFTRHGQLGVPGAADFGDWINSASAACAYTPLENEANCSLIDRFGPCGGLFCAMVPYCSGVLKQG